MTEQEVIDLLMEKVLGDVTDEFYSTATFWYFPLAAYKPTWDLKTNIHGVKFIRNVYPDLGGPKWVPFSICYK